MGADIHAYVEFKINGQWVDVTHRAYNIDTGQFDIARDLNINRNYKLFSHLAGVRNVDDIEPISEPRGLPEDLSQGIRDVYDEIWSYDGHSGSWLTFREIGQRYDTYWALLPYLSPYMYRETDRRIEDKRLVFWFDN